MDVEDISKIIAERLVKLRTSKGLSHNGLKKELLLKYGVEISRDSLMNYEVSDMNHTKFGKNMGMRIEYLLCLADYYHVSADYLLSLSEYPNPGKSAIAAAEREKTVQELADSVDDAIARLTFVSMMIRRKT